GLGTSDSRSWELTAIRATDSQSVVATLHNTLHPCASTRPADASAALRAVSYVLGGLLTALTIWAGYRHSSLGGARLCIYMGVLILDMLLLCPVCHFHYFCLALPLVMGLLAAAWDGPGRRATWDSLGWGTKLGLSVYLSACILPRFPDLFALRE